MPDRAGVRKRGRPALRESVPLLLCGLLSSCDRGLNAVGGVRMAPVVDGRSGLCEYARKMGDGRGGGMCPSFECVGRSDAERASRGSAVEGRLGVPYFNNGACRRTGEVLREDAALRVNVERRGESSFSSGDGRRGDVRVLGRVGDGRRGRCVMSADEDNVGSLPPNRLGLRSAARSGSSALRLKLTSGSPAALCASRASLRMSSPVSSTTTPCNQPSVRPVSDMAWSTSLVTLDVDRSRTELSWEEAREGF